MLRRSERYTVDLMELQADPEDASRRVGSSEGGCEVHASVEEGRPWKPVVTVVVFIVTVAIGVRLLLYQGGQQGGDALHSQSVSAARDLMLPTAQQAWDTIANATCPEIALQLSGPLAPVQEWARRAKCGEVDESPWCSEFRRLLWGIPPHAEASAHGCKCDAIWATTRHVPREAREVLAKVVGGGGSLDRRPSAALQSRGSVRRCAVSLYVLEMPPGEPCSAPHALHALPAVFAHKPCLGRGGTECGCAGVVQPSPRLLQWQQAPPCQHA